MDRLCFGTFALELKDALQEPNSNQSAVVLLLGFIEDVASEGDLSPNFSISPKLVSALVNLKCEVPGGIVNLASTQKVIDAMPAIMKSKIVPFLKKQKIEDMKENLRKLIIGDEGISPVMRKNLLLLADKGQEYLLLTVSEGTLSGVSRKVTKCR